MDPASAIGVASAAISFLDFTIKLCQLAEEVSSSHNGATAYNADLEAEINKFKQTTKDVSSMQLPSQLKSVVDESIAASTDLLRLLECIRESKDDKKFGTLKAIYMSLRHRSEVVTLERRVDKCRRLVAEGLSQETFKNSIALHKLSDTKLQSLDTRSTEILQTLKSGNDITISLLNSGNDLQQRLGDRFSGLENTIRARNDDIASKVDSLTQRVLDMAKSNLKEAFIDSLFFPQFRQRETDVSDPCTTTFEWFFDPQGGAESSTTRSQGPDRAPWQSFPRWLEDASSNQQYWLSGKAGSGKSTLMAQIIRNQKRTERHLEKWSGSRPLYFLSFFLFRAGSQLQVGFVYLLRSLLYQLVDQIPALQEVLMTRFLPTGSNTRIPEWPVSTLKKMLSFAIDIADDCNFFFAVDGVDEFQSGAQPRSEDATVIDLINFLQDIQKPSHVKLCVSSRPELCLSERYPSFLETKLSKLNRQDIRIFVYDRMSALPQIDKRDTLSEIICHRADGMFMWTVFALREMEAGLCFKETYAQLVTRLDSMGRSLESAIAHMLQGIARPHKATVSFYLQALGSWNAAEHCSTHDKMSVALMAVSRSSEESLSMRSLADLCRKEEQALRKFTRGLVEVNTISSRPTSKGRRLLVNRHDSVPIVAGSRHDRLQCCDDHPWTLVPNNGYLSELCDWCTSSVSLIHRSAYDFFFPESNSEALEPARLLSRWNDTTEVPAALQRGLWKLLYLQPILLHESSSSQSDRLKAALAQRYNTILHYTAGARFSPQDLAIAADRILSAMRLELLPSRSGSSSHMERKHVPGDIFSQKILNGSLQLIDDDKFCNSDSMKNHDDLLILAAHESEFWIECGRHTTMDVYSHDRLGHLHEHRFGYLVLALLAQKSDQLGAEHLIVVLESIHSWTQQMIRRRQSAGTPGLSWLWRLRADSGTTSSRPLQEIRISETDWLLGQSQPTCFQWTPHWQLEDNDRFETDLVVTLMKMLFASREGQSPLFEKISRVIKPWDTWVTIIFEDEPDAISSRSISDSACAVDQLFHTRLFVSLNAACEFPTSFSSTPKIFQVARLREEDDGSAKVMYCHTVNSPLNINPHTEFWKMLHPSVATTPHTELWELLSYPLQALEERVINAIIADVQGSTTLSPNQIGAMVEGVRRWPSCQSFD